MSLTPEQLLLVETRVANDKKSVALAFAFWFFLGILSAHRFYLGRPGTAILQILSYLIIIGIVWWVIDAFLIPGMIRRDTDRMREDLIRQLELASAPPYDRRSF